MQEPALREQVLAGLDDPNPEVQRAAVRVSLEHFLNDPETAPLVKTAFANLNSSARGILIEEVGNPKFMRRHLGVSGGAVSQDQQYFLGKNGGLSKGAGFSGESHRARHGAGHLARPRRQRARRRARRSAQGEGR